MPYAGPHLWSPIVRNGLLAVLAGLVVLWWVRARSDGGTPARVSRIVAVVIGACGWVLVCYGAFVAAGPTGPIAKQLLPGVSYERFVHDAAVVHLVTVDLANPCVVPAASAVAADGTAAALKTVTWAEREAMAVAINGSFFFPYDQSRFWDVKPSEGEPVTVLGPSVSEGSLSVADTEWRGHTLSIDSGGNASIGPGVATDAVVAVTGRHRLIEGGRVVAPPSDPYPRTVVGLDDGGRTMWWLVLDAVRGLHSNGLPLEQAAAILTERGANDAVEFDGGGSSILVARSGRGPDTQVERLSRPMQIRIPGRSRAVANHLGLRVPTAPGC